MKTSLSTVNARLRDVREEIQLLEACNRWFASQLYPSEEEKRQFNERITRLQHIREEIALLASHLNN